MARHRSSERTTPNILGGQIRGVRETRGWTQEKLAEQLQLAGWSISRDVVARIETGRRTIIDVELLLLSRVLEFSVDQLLNQIRTPLVEIAAKLPDRNKRWSPD